MAAQKVLKISTLLFSEIRFRRVNFLLGSISIAAAVLVLFVAGMHITSEKRNANLRAIEKEEQMRLAMENVKQKYRHITRSLGYTIRVLPPGQKAVDFYDRGFSIRTSPEKTAALTASLPGAIRMIVPVLRRKIFHKQFQRQVLVCGVGKPLFGPSNKTANSSLPPSLRQVPKGTALIGYELQSLLKSKRFSQRGFHMMGNSFKTVYDSCQQGSIDDITIWLDLGDAQKIFNCPGQISETWVWGNLTPSFSNKNLAEKIKTNMPAFTVIEVSRDALLQVRAQIAAQQTASEAITLERKSQNRMMRQRNRLYLSAAGAVLMLTLLWSLLLTINNVVQRTHETGLYHALGFSHTQIFILLSGRTLCMGLTGTAAGSLSALLIASLFSLNITAKELVISITLTSVIMPGINMLLGAVPIIRTLRLQPSTILAEEIKG